MNVSHFGVEWFYINRVLYVDAGPYAQYLMTHERPKVLLVDILAKVTEHSTLRACSLVEATEHYTEVCIFRGYVFQLCLFICLHECLYLFNFSLGFEVIIGVTFFNPLNPELNPICYLLAFLGAHHFLHVSTIRVKLLTLRLLISYIYIWSTYS